jgi:hypothetical protein
MINWDDVGQAVDTLMDCYVTCSLLQRQLYCSYDSVRSISRRYKSLWRSKTWNEPRWDLYESTFPCIFAAWMRRHTIHNFLFQNAHYVSKPVTKNYCQQAKISSFSRSLMKDLADVDPMTAQGFSPKKSSLSPFSSGHPRRWINNQANVHYCSAYTRPGGADQNEVRLR